MGLSIVDRSNKNQPTQPCESLAAVKHRVIREETPPMSVDGTYRATASAGLAAANGSTTLGTARVTHAG